MNSPAPAMAASPSGEALDQLAVSLVQQASQLSRLVFTRLDVTLSRTEASLLARLEAAPQRITALADLDGLAQPTVTLLVKRLEGEGLVCRRRSAQDGRVVLVSLTPGGHAALEVVRARYRELLRRCMADLPSEDIETLERAVGATGALIGRLQREGMR